MFPNIFTFRYVIEKKTTKPETNTFVSMNLSRKKESKRKKKLSEMYVYFTINISSCNTFKRSNTYTNDV